MFTLFLILLSSLPAKPTSTFSQPVSCQRVAWLNLRTGESGHTYCLVEPALDKILGITKKVPRSVSWIEDVDCRKAFGTHVCKTSARASALK